MKKWHRWFKWLGLALVCIYITAVLIYFLLWGALLGDPKRFYWGLIAVGIVSVAAAIMVVCLLRRMDRMETSYMSRIGELRRRMDRIEYGHGLSSRQHRILCMRLSGFTYREIDTVSKFGMSTIEREVSYLKDIGLLE